MNDEQMIIFQHEIQTHLQKAVHSGALVLEPTCKSFALDSHVFNENNVQGKYCASCINDLWLNTDQLICGSMLHTLNPDFIAL